MEVGTCQDRWEWNVSPVRLNLEEVCREYLIRLNFGSKRGDVSRSALTAVETDILIE
jgi:hypothetical protein